MISVLAQLSSYVCQDVVKCPRQLLYFHSATFYHMYKGDVKGCQGSIHEGVI